MTFLRSRVTSLFFLACFVTTACMHQMQAQGVKNLEKLKPPMLLSSLLFSSESGITTLTMWEVFIRRPTAAEFYKHKGQLPNTAFVIVASSGPTVENGRVVWVRYAFNNPALLPEDVWSGGIVRDTLGHCFAMLVKSIAPNVNLWVDRLDVSNTLAQFPLRLEPANFEQWPISEPVEVSRLEKSMYARNISAVRSAQLLSQSNALIVLLKMEDENIAPSWLQFDFLSNKWSDLSVTVKPGVVRK